MDWGETQKVPVSATVSNPEIQGVRRRKYTDWLVTSQFSDGAKSLIRRTMEDFQWLHSRLNDEYKGIIIPILPERVAANNTIKFSEEFVQDCTSVLSRFLTRVMDHPELVNASCLADFLTANESQWKEILEKEAEIETKTSVDESVHSETNGGLFIDADAASHDVQVTEKKKGNMMGRWISARRERRALDNPNIILEETPAESKRFYELQEYADKMEVCIQIIVEDSKAFTAAYKVQAEKLQTIGGAFSQMWGEHELANTSASNMYQTLGDNMGSLHKQVEGMHTFGVQFLDTPFEELLLDVKALKNALRMRKKVLYDYTKKVKLNRDMQAQMDRLKASNDMTTVSEKYYKIEGELRILDLQLAEEKKLTEMITMRLGKDVDRFRIEFHNRMREILEHYNSGQAGFLQGQTQLYLDVLPSLSKGIDTTKPNLPKEKSKTQTPGIKLSFTTTGASVTVDSIKNAVKDLSIQEKASAPVEVSAVSDSVSETVDIPVDDSDITFDAVPMGGEVAPPPASAPPPPPP